MLYGNKIKQIFLVILLGMSIYVLFIKTHLFVSQSSILIKNIEGTTQAPSLLGMISGQTSNSQQDTLIVEEYLNSYELFDKLDKKFQLKKHYASNTQDFLQRMYSWNKYEDYLEFYRSRLTLRYDEISSILYISFLHTNPQKSREIVSFLINEAEQKLNSYNQVVAQKYLKFIEDETSKYKKELFASIKQLESYQNKHNILDPTNQATSNVEILSALHSKLVEKEGLLRNLQSYQTPKSIEIINIKQEIFQLKRSIEDLNSNLSGKNPNRINKTIFEYSQLKAKVDLYNELYKQSLLQLQNAKVMTHKQAKTMQILVNPSLATSYTEPNKLSDLLNIVLILGILYGIISLLLAIIKDHKE